MSARQAPRPIAITMGDPSGIGPEIVCRLFADGIAAPAVALGDAGRLREAAAIVSPSLVVREIASRRQARPAPGVLEVIAAGALPADLPFGAVSAAAGAASFAYVERAIDLALAGEVSAVVTAPINKEAWRAAGVAYPGHTELFAERCGVSDYAMALVSDELRVLLVSIHLSLAGAIGAVTPERERIAIRLAHEACRRFGVARPRVAVAGLNPHAGEHGLFGAEDEAVIRPAVAEAKALGIDASGPWPGDTVFMRARRGDFDIVVAQYHDQGLIPIKLMGLDKGVNITVGLPFVRTSVDHGTAFDIAGKGIADAASLRAALDCAAAMTRAEART